MHISTHQTESEAAASPQDEARAWAEIAGSWREADHRRLWDDTPGAERVVVGFFDPRRDIDRRARQWSYQPVGYDFSDLARFASGLALAEAEAWRHDRPHLATKAFEERRFLISDRIVHWAVPWLHMVVRCHPVLGELAHQTIETLLDIGDRIRLAPALVGSEGLVVPGFDSFGPIDSGAGLAKTLTSVWSGAVLSIHDLTDIRHAIIRTREVPLEWLQSADTRNLLATFYRDAARSWDLLAARHPGTAQLWRDLSHRAQRTAGTLSH